MSGYIFNFKGHGAFTPDGKVYEEMTEAQIKAHNSALARAEVEAMKEHGCAVLYLHTVDNKTTIGTWTLQAPTFPVNHSKTSRHYVPNCWRQVKRTDYWFTGPDGKAWHGVNIGDNDIVRCKRLKS